MVKKKREAKAEEMEKEYNHALVKENSQRFFSVTQIFLCSEVKLLHIFKSNHREKRTSYSLYSLELSKAQTCSVAFHAIPTTCLGERNYNFHIFVEDGYMGCQL